MCKDAYSTYHFAFVGLMISKNALTMRAASWLKSCVASKALSRRHCYSFSVSNAT